MRAAGEETINYLKGLGLKEIYIFGGNGAVSEEVEIQLETMRMVFPPLYAKFPKKPKKPVLRI
jgi:hypothetical protein